MVEKKLRIVLHENDMTTYITLNQQSNEAERMKKTLRQEQGFIKSRNIDTQH